MIVTIDQIFLLIPAQKCLGSFYLKFIWEGKLSSRHSFMGKKGLDSSAFTLTCAVLPGVDEALSSLAPGTGDLGI